MALIDPLLGARLVFILGITNIISLLLVFFSCRCMVGQRLFEKLFQFNWYKKFYSIHCYLWRIFFVSVIVHTLLAFIIFGSPF